MCSTDPTKHTTDWPIQRTTQSSNICTYQYSPDIFRRYYFPPWYITYRKYILSLDRDTDPAEIKCFSSEIGWHDPITNSISGILRGQTPLPAAWESPQRCKQVPGWSIRQILLRSMQNTLASVSQVYDNREILSHCLEIAEIQMQHDMWIDININSVWNTPARRHMITPHV